MNRTEELEAIISQNIEAYAKGNSKISDLEFDLLVEELEELSPDSPILLQIEGDLAGNYPKVTLPFRSYSQKKTKSIKDLQNWIKTSKSRLNDEDVTFTFCISPKYDGIYIEEVQNSKYTRGKDGIIGQDVSSRANKMKVFAANTPSLEAAFGGELIVSKVNFENYFLNAEYTSPRNLIPALFSNEKLPANLDKVDYIRYTICNIPMYKDIQIDYCNRFNQVQVPYYLCYEEDLTEEYLDNLFELWSKDYYIDGLVIDINEYEIREELGYLNKYPQFSRAYKPSKFNKELFKTKINNLRYQVSRYGKIAPIAEITPVEINNGMVSNISLYNMKYIVDNNIQIGTEGYVFRAGAINPKFDSFINNEKQIEELKFCPCCGASIKWDENHVDMYCSNYENCSNSTSNKIYFFLKTIGIKEFGLKTVQAFVDEGFTSVSDFLNENKVELTIVKGVGAITKLSYLTQLRELQKKGIIIEKVQAASGIFPGIGEQSFKILNKVVIDLEYYYNDKYYNLKLKELLSLPEIGEITAETYLSKVIEFHKFCNKDLYNYPIVYHLKSEIENIFLNEDILLGEKYIFTGFRDEELKNKIIQKGGEVLNSLSSKCTCVIAKDITKESGNIEKAKKLNIKIVSKEEFQALLN